MSTPSDIEGARAMLNSKARGIAMPGWGLGQMRAAVMSYGGPDTYSLLALHDWIRAWAGPAPEVPPYSGNDGGANGE